MKKQAGKTSRAVATRKSKETLARVDEKALITDLRGLIHAARQRIAVVANSTTTLLYWHLGRRLLTENLQDGRAEYGKQILATVSRELTAEFGRGFTYTEVTRMIRFAEDFPDQEIVASLAQQLSWGHFMELLQLDAKSIRVSEYLTELPPIKLLQARLHQAIEHARELTARHASRADKMEEPGR